MLKRLAALATLSLACAAGPVAAQGVAPQVRTLDIYVDLPTGFTFVKMPAGWKFVGKLDAAQMRDLPSTTLTSLLPADEEATLATSTAAAAPVQAR